MAPTSANLNDLLTYINDLSGDGKGGGAFGTEFESVVKKQGSVFAACQSTGDGLGFQVPDSPGLVALGKLYENWATNCKWVNGIRDALIKADNYDGDGNATAPTSSITDYLKRNQLDTEPTNIEIGDVQLHGQPPYSGMIDDPINAANGNFTDFVADLEMPGVTREIAVTRTYNSRAIDREGSFGAGWSSLIDSRLEVGDRAITFLLPDGGAAVFAADGEGGYAPDRRRHMWLTEETGGWQVRLGGSTWRFDAEGTLLRAETAATEVHFERTSDAVVVAETRSGRTVRYAKHPETGRVIRAETSDGRVSRYRYNSDGNLTTAERPQGTLRYEVDDTGLVLSITDADDVLVCRNTYDRWGRVATQVESHGRETTYHYEPGGVFRVLANDDAPPNVMVHDRRGRMTTMIDGLGHTMRLAYDDADNLVKAVDRTGAVTEYGYDDRGNMTRRIDPDGIEVSITYDSMDRPVEITDRAGGVWRMGYEGSHQLPSVTTQPDGVRVHVTLDDADRPVAMVDGDGVTFGLEWTADSQVAAAIDGEGNATRFLYDDAGNLVSHIDPLGAIGEWQFDLAGRLVRWAGPVGEEQRTYSPGGRMISEFTANGYAWRAELDDAGEIAQVDTVSGETVSYERDSVGQVTAIIRDGARVKQFEYDPTGRVAVVVDALGGRITRTYDEEGRLTGVTDATGATLIRTVDVLGRTRSMTSPSGEVVERTYHPTGALASVVDAVGNTWRFDVDALGRRTATHDPMGNVTRFEYTPGGRPHRVISPLGRITEYAYDAAGRCTRIQHPDGTTVELDRLANGAVASVERTANDVARTTSFGYSASGRMSSLDGHTGSLAIAERGGEVASVSRNGGIAHFDREPGGILSRVVDPAGIETGFGHNSRGRLTEHRTGGSTTRYGYDPADRVSQIIDTYGRVTGFSRDHRGDVVGVAHADGSEVRYVIGVNGSIEALYDGDDDLLLGFDRNANGRIVRTTGDAGTTELTLDPRGLVTAVSSPGGDLEYDWDADGRCAGWRDHIGFGVVIERDDPAGVCRYQVPGRVIETPGAPDRTLDEYGRIVVDEDGRTYAYDDAGRLSATEANGAARSFEYNESGLLSSEQVPSGEVTYEYGACGEVLVRRSPSTETHYTYDARGRRVRESGSDGSQVDYRWDALGRLRGYTVTSVDGSVTERTFRYSTASRPSRIDDVAILWDAGRGGDLLGIGDQRFLWHGTDVLVASDPDGDWSRRLTDDPWGDDGGTGIRLGYRGALACDRYLLLGDRVYDPSTRQFLSRDPLPPVPGRLDFAALYSYCYSDPVNYVDPSGRKPLSDEEFELSRQGWGVRAAHATVDFVKDNWKQIAIVAGSVVLGAVLTPLVGPIAAGAIAGAVGNAALTAVEGGSMGDIAKSALIGGVTGMMGGGLAARFAQPAGLLTRAGPLAPSTAQNVGARLAENATKQAALALPGAVTAEGLDSTVPFPGAKDPDGNFEWNKVAAETAGSAVGGSAVDEANFRTRIPGPLDSPVSTADPQTPTGPDTDLPAPDTTPDTTPTADTPNPPVSREDLTNINGIGDKTADSVLDYIDQHGVPDDLTEIPGVGEKRAEMLSGLL